MHEGTSHQPNANSFAGPADHDSLMARHRIDDAGKQSKFFYNRFHRHRFPSHYWAAVRWTTTMRTIQKVAIASTIAFSALAIFPMTASTAQAGPIVPLGHYCLSYDLGGTDCSFTSYAQCQATASGLAAECYGKTARDDEHESPWGAGRLHSLR
jgi:hypothetical protein